MKNLQELNTKVNKALTLKKDLDAKVSEFESVLSESARLRKNRERNAASETDVKLYGLNQKRLLLYGDISAVRKEVRNLNKIVEKEILESYTANENNKQSDYSEIKKGLTETADTFYGGKTKIIFPEIGSVATEGSNVTFVIYTDEEKDDGKVAYVKIAGLCGEKTVKPEIYVFAFDKERRKGEIKKAVDYKFKNKEVKTTEQSVYSSVTSADADNGAPIIENSADSDNTGNEIVKTQCDKYFPNNKIIYIKSVIFSFLSGITVGAAILAIILKILGKL